MNEPVAYRWKSNLGYIYDIYDHGNGEPLYTHPAKTLTDEEILEIGGACAKNPDRNFQITFARAILKKASEK